MTAPEPSPGQAAREELEATFRRTFALHPGDFKTKYEQARDAVMAAADAYALAAQEPQPAPVYICPHYGAEDDDEAAPEALAAIEDADPFHSGMHFTESLCPSTLGLIGGGSLPCNRELHHRDPHANLGARVQWTGTGPSAVTVADL